MLLIVIMILFWKSNANSTIKEISTIGLILSFIVLIVNLFWCITDSIVATNSERYEILNYQIQNKLYDNENDISYGKKKLMEEVQEWNEDLACYQKLQNNFWIGIYVPNIYDEFEFIDYSNIK